MPWTEMAGLMRWQARRNAFSESVRPVGSAKMWSRLPGLLLPFSAVRISTAASAAMRPKKLSARTAKLGWMKIGQPFGVVAEAGVGACADDLLNFQPDRLGAADEIDGR